MVHRAARNTFVELGAVLDEVTAALLEGSPERAENALVSARQLDQRVDSLSQAVTAGQETARLAPQRRRARGQLERYATAAGQVDLPVRNTRVLARAAQQAVRDGGASPKALAGP